MLVTMSDLLWDARKNAYAVGAFNVPNLESVRAVVEAAEEEKQPVILQHAEVHEGLVPMEVIGPIMLHFARKASVPVSVHLDHGASFGQCVRAMRLGFTSVMYDASEKPFEQNAKETGEIVKIARALGVSVEAELGRVFTSAVGGGEGRGAMGAEDFASLDDCYTNPEDARKFVAATGVDALAVCFGTVHGVYLTEPVLNLDRIAEIRNKTDVPLVMHGGSGISKEDCRAAIKNGIAKINYFTYMSMAGGEAVARSLAGREDGGRVFFHDMVQTARDAMKENVREAIRIFSMKP